MDKVLILGINGFTGQHFDSYIHKNSLSKEFDFLGVDMVINKSFSVQTIKRDLLQGDSITNLIETERPDYILNLVGTFQTSVFETFLALNAGITQKLFEAILKVKQNVKKVLLVGSAAEYGIPSTLPIKEDMPLRPVNWYGLTKSIQTYYAQFYFWNKKIPVIVARTFNIIGKGVSLSLSIGGFIDRIGRAKNGDTIEVGNTETKRDFLDVEDVVDAYWKLLLAGRPGEIYNVCRGESHYIKDILAYLIKISKKSLNIKMNEAFSRASDIPDIYGDNSKLRQDTRWVPNHNIFDSLNAAI